MMTRRNRILAVVFAAALAAAGAGLAFEYARAQRASEAAEAALRPVRPRDPCQRVKPSQLAKKYLETLHGVEIGASTQNSFDLKRSINVDFSDEQGGLWQHKDCEPAVVKIVAPGDDLPFKDGTLDYVVSAHVIEHFFDPVKALKEWYRVIRPGGYIFIIAPHRDRTFDRHREVTPVAELMERAAGRLRVQDYARPLDQKAMVKTPDGASVPAWEAAPHRLVRGGAPMEPGWAYFEADDHHQQGRDQQPVDVQNAEDAPGQLGVALHAFRVAFRHRSALLRSAGL